MTTLESNLNKYFAEIKMALMEYASNVLYIKNIHRSIANPKDQKFIIKTCNSVEKIQQHILNYIEQCLSSENKGCLTKPFLFCEPTIAEIHIDRFSSKYFLRFLNIQKGLFFETINSIFMTLCNNSPLESQSLMQAHHKKILQLFSGKSSFTLPNLFKRKTLAQSNDPTSFELDSQTDPLFASDSSNEYQTSPLSDLQTSINLNEQTDQHNAVQLQDELNQLRKKMSQLEKDKIAAEEQHHRVEAERKKLESAHIDLNEAARREREKIAEEQKRQLAEVEQQFLEAKKIAAEQAAKLEREKIAEEQKRQRVEAEQQLLEAKKIAAEQAAKLEREKIAEEQKRLQEQLEKDRIAHEQRVTAENEQKKNEKRLEEQKARDEVARIEREKIAEEQKVKLQITDKKQLQELEKLQLKEQELNKKRNELQEIEGLLHEKEREQQLIIQELLTVSRYLNQKENELQEIIKTKHGLEQELHKINEKLHEYENKKRDNADTLLQLERKRRQHAVDATHLENAWQRQVKNLQPDMALIKSSTPPRKKHSLELEEAAARLKQTGTEERT